MADEFIGVVINGYEILRLIGVGGMARVYLARQQSMNRQVALKVLPQQFLNDDTYLQRFNREVKIVSQLEHAHIVPVYDYGEYKSQPYIVMRYMPSGTVDDLLNHGTLDLATVLDILTQIAPALDHAHSKGVLHRDLKPSNVLMDETGSAFLSDFGIARLSESNGIAITTQGVVGTPSYMSPEQAQGKDMDGRSDLYSLGVMLFEMTTGRRPFEAETPYSIAVMQVTTPAPSPRLYNPELPQSVERVILRILRKDPLERPQKASVLVEELRHAIQHANKDDTDPKLNASMVAQAVAQMTPPQPVMPHALPANTPAPQYNVSQQQPRYPSASYAMPIVPRKAATPWGSIALGGGLGCLFLFVIIAIALMGLNALLPQPRITVTTTPQSVLIPSQAVTLPPTPDTSSPTPTLDATSEAARATLLAGQTSNQATMTAVFATNTPPGGSAGSSSTDVPVGLNGASALNSALSGASGTIIYADQRGESNTFQIVKLNLSSGVETQLTADNANNSYPVVSPNGQWVTFQSDRDGDYDIYVMNLAGGQLRRLTNNLYSDRVPGWSPDSAWVVYSADVRGDGAFDILRTTLDGSTTEVLVSNSERKSHARYSADGRYLVYTSGTDPNDARTWEIARYDTTTGEIAKLTQNDLRDASPTFNAQGKIMYIAYQGTQANAIAIMNLDGSDARLLYNDGQNNWAAAASPDGQYIVFTRYDGASDQLFLMTASGTDAQQLTLSGGNSGTWAP